MYVCICKNVNDKAVRKAVARGACTLRDLRAELGVGTCCGRCVPELRSILANATPPAPVREGFDSGTLGAAAA